MSFLPNPMRAPFKIAGLTLALLLPPALLPSTAGATEVGRSRPLGFGFALGDPASLVAKYFVSPRNAWDFGLGLWTYGRVCNADFCTGRTRVSFNTDYLWQDQITTGATATLDWHIGAGGRLWLFSDDFAVAARMPIGVDLTFRKPSFLEVFLELAPAVYVVPGVNLDFEALLGVRLYP